MKRVKVFSFVVLIVLIAAVSFVLTGTAQSADPASDGIKVTPIGNPTWKIVDIHLLSAPIGTKEDGYAGFTQTVCTLLPEPYHNCGNPGAPHQPPYDQEFTNGIANLGFHEGNKFSVKEFSGGKGVYLVWMTVPGPGEIGPSPDFLSGPIIPNRLFPIQLRGISYYQDGTVFDQSLAYLDVPTLDQFNPPIYGVNHSHFPIFIADDASFGPEGANLNGSFFYRIDVKDATGNGWHIDAHFTLTP